MSCKGLCRLTSSFLLWTPGSYGNIYESSLLRPGQCSLSQGNLSIYSPRWQGSSSELDSSRQVMRRSQTTAAIPECQLHPAVSRVCSNPHIEASGRSLDQSRSKSERHLTLSSVEDLTEYDLHAGCSQSTAKPSYRKERPPPPYPGPAKTSSALSQRSGVSSTLHSLWRLQRQEKSSGTRAAGGPAAKAPEQAISRQERSAPHTQVGNIYSTAAHNQNSKNVSEPDWHDWQRERWQIWELLSADNPDALPETLVWSNSTELPLITLPPCHRKTTVMLENWGLVCFLPTKLHIIFLNLVHFNFLTALSSNPFTNTVCSCFSASFWEKKMKILV